MQRAWLFAIVLAGCGASVSVTGQWSRGVAETPSGKRVSVYRSSDFATEARDVNEDVVVQAMHASSLFFEEDIRALSPKVAPELGRLKHDERVVIVTRDTAIYMFVAAGELQILALRDGLEVSHHASPIPTAAVKTELTQRRRPVAPPAVAVPPQETAALPPRSEPAPQAAPRPDAGPPPPQTAVVTPTTPAPAKSTPAKVKAKPKAAKPAPTPAPTLTEEQIREKLDQLDRLRAKDLITQEDYEKKKKALLDQL